MCPDQGLNLQHFGACDNTPTNWATQPGPIPTLREKSECPRKVEDHLGIRYLYPPCTLSVWWRIRIIHMMNTYLHRWSFGNLGEEVARGWSHHFKSLDTLLRPTCSTRANGANLPDILYTYSLFHHTRRFHPPLASLPSSYHATAMPGVTFYPRYSKRKDESQFDGDGQVKW